jgi:Domain of unknown function (DUF4288)
MWYSANIRLICLIEREGATRYMDSVFIYTSESYELAFAKAIQIGKNQEEEYVNGTGQRVLWRLKEIVSLDKLTFSSEEYTEVYSEPKEIEDGVFIPFNSTFHPEQSLPTQSIPWKPIPEGENF